MNRKKDQAPNKYYANTWEGVSSSAGNVCQSCLMTVDIFMRHSKVNWSNPCAYIKNDRH